MTVTIYKSLDLVKNFRKISIFVKKLQKSRF